MVSDTLLQYSPSSHGRYIGSPISRLGTPVRCGRVHRDEVILGSLLGTGGFGSVYVASIRGRTVAVKTYHKRCANPRAVRQSYSNELLAFRTGLKHSNVVSILGATTLHGFEDGAWIFMDYVGPNTLQSLLNDHRQELDCTTRLSLALQMARGLHYLHSFGLMHLDLKPANCLVTNELQLRITDFGCCHQLVPGRERGGQEVVAEGLSPAPGAWKNELVGTLAYRAPELLKGQKPSLCCDVYSLGITLWQMRTRQGPYEGVPAHAVVYQVVSNDLRPRLPSEDEDNPFEVIFADLYTQCWASSGDDRPSSLHIVHTIDLWLEYM
ncbi:serine/threonine-protein kinase mos-like [Babylonia areolata]|uniref:serine/threonine-protein kinase mos-like n=1 Tax=Babylonia areolata TaxID=304850 RepID=UPI003FD6185A